MIGAYLVSCYVLLSLAASYIPSTSLQISQEYGESPPVSPSGAALFSVQFSVQAGGIEANRCVDGGSVATVVAKSMGYANLHNYV